jgi:hypothetical protein
VVFSEDNDAIMIYDTAERVVSKLSHMFLTHEEDFYDAMHLKSCLVMQFTDNHFNSVILYTNLFSFELYINDGRESRS